MAKTGTCLKQLRILGFSILLYPKKQHPDTIVYYTWTIKGIDLIFCTLSPKYIDFDWIAENFSSIASILFLESYEKWTSVLFGGSCIWTFEASLPKKSYFEQPLWSNWTQIWISFDFQAISMTFLSEKRSEKAKLVKTTSWINPESNVSTIDILYITGDFTWNNQPKVTF